MIRFDAWKRTLSVGTILGALAISTALSLPSGQGDGLTDFQRDTRTLLREGRETFQFDTFGDEQFWGGSLKLHDAVSGAAQGGVGPGLSPSAALGLGLKVDADALPAALKAQIAAGQVDLDDPAVTLALLQLDSVVGVTGFFDNQSRLTSMGIQCAICHSTVDDSFAPGIGVRLDGWANRDLDIGRIVSLAPDLSPVSTLLGVTDDVVRRVLRSWGPGKFDAELFLDGKAFQPDGRSAATLIPPAFGLQGVNLHTYTGWGSLTYWNAFVANIEMHGQGNFSDARLADAQKFPIAAQAGFDDIRNAVDRITPKLGGLHYYQMSLRAPEPPAGSFDPASAARGQVVFESAGCVRCHVPPLFTEPGWNMHKGAEIGIDDFQADRSPDGAYRTTPLKGLWTHQKGGFYHDGRFANLDEVLAHYNAFFNLGLGPQDQADVVQYLLSL